MKPKSSRPVYVFFFLFFAQPATVANSQEIWSPSDSSVYSDSATAATVILARARHYHRDSIIKNYSAIATTRADAGIGKRRFGLIPPMLATETVSRVSWQYPNDLRLEILGARDTSALAGVDEITMDFDRPWFVPRSVGDSIGLLEGGFPENSALHPLAEGAGEFYHYAIVDSVTISIPGLTVRAINVRVEPRKEAPALVAGDIWIDADSHEVVRMAILFVGTSLWTDLDDEGSSDRERDLANRVLSAKADLEYALYEQKYWLPFRQLVTLDVEIPWVLNVKIPVRFITEFSDYEINTLPPIVFTVPLEELQVPDDNDSTQLRWRNRVHCPGCGSAEPDSGQGRVRTQRRRAEVGYTRAGGDGIERWEIVNPPRDSLEAYEWDEKLNLGLGPDDEARVRETLGELAHLAEDLEGSLVGRTNRALAWREVADVVRFNRVQGWSFGMGYMIRPGPAFTTIYGQARFGLGDLRPMAELAWQREAPEGTFELRGFRSVGETDPWSKGQSLGNSLNATFAAHDDADYFTRLGAAVSFEFYSRTLSEMKLELSYERHRSMVTESGAIFTSIRSNPPVLEGEFVRGNIEQRLPFASGVAISGFEGLAGESLRAARLWTSFERQIPNVFNTVITGRVGGTFGDNIPQFLYRVGGPHTVRGHPYGSRIGPDFWSVQVDVPIKPSNALSPVAFFDIGNVFSRNDPLMGVGVGWSLFDGWMRPNLSYGFNPDEGFRFDLLFGAAR